MTIQQQSYLRSLLNPKAAVTCAAVSAGMVWAANHELPLEELLDKVAGRAAFSFVAAGAYITNIVERGGRIAKNASQLAVHCAVVAPTIWCLPEYMILRSIDTPNAESVVGIDYALTSAIGTYFAVREYNRSREVAQ